MMNLMLLFESNLTKNGLSAFSEMIDFFSQLLSSLLFLRHTTISTLICGEGWLSD
jgi:hypothetical protein